MGYTVYCNGKDIWSPSLAVGKYFIGNVQILENFIEIESGITVPLSDSIEIDSEKLAVFVKKLLELVEENNNTPLFAMISGTSQILIAISKRINNYEPKITTKNYDLISKSKRVFSSIEDYSN